MRTRQEELFVERLNYYRSGLDKKQRTKKCLRLVEAVGRLREKYPKASKMYDVEVVPENKPGVEQKNLNAIGIRFERREVVTKAEIENEGSYVLRTDRMDLDAKEIWKIYVMLTRVEDSFRSMKSHLGFRPVFHQKKERCETHLFISVLAYRLMNIITHRLKKAGTRHNWSTIRQKLTTHQRMTLSYDTRTEQGGLNRHHVRMNSRPTPDQQKIYLALGIPMSPLPTRRLAHSSQIGSDDKNPIFP